MSYPRTYFASRIAGEAARQAMRQHELDRIRRCTRDPHAQGSSEPVETLGRWREWLACEGCDLLVWNPKSLLARTLPVYAAN